MSKAFLLGLLLLFSGLVFWIESESRQQPLGPEKVEAYLSFISWMQEHGKEYREAEVNNRSSKGKVVSLSAILAELSAD
jgi:hypothetical protein